MNFFDTLKEKGRKEMSKEMPEVGDVWERKGNKYFIRDILCFSHPQICFIDEDLTKDGEPLHIFLNNWKYIGKAKGSLQDLFEVKRPVNKDRMKDGKRWCYKCQTYKDLDCFYVDRSIKDGISNTCRECNNKRAKERRLMKKITGTK